MNSQKTTSLIDVPRCKEGEDLFGIDPYQKGLIQFIEHAETPITIALQGEWGSGKTSLMNVLEKDLCENDGSFLKVWLNTWEHALMKDAKTALIGIIAALIEKVADIADEGDKKAIVKKFFKVAKSMALNIASTQANKLVDSSGDAIIALAEAFSSDSNTIGSLRDDLEKLIERSIKKKEKKGVVFFIDDLDRIDPPVAVLLLELLKNIFTLKNCVFVLAIDYEVVIKGLEPKFGKFCDANEREFRSFFDKIIQLPFSMPVSSYKIDNFLMSSLHAIGYLTDEQAQKKEVQDFIARTAGYTVGHNPRSLKRLVNSLSLIGCINKSKPNEESDDESNPELDLQVNFALVSLQVAYPAIYRMVAKRPGFDAWDEKSAMEFNLKRLTNEQVAKLQAYEEFDEPWELVLFQACEIDSYLRSRALYVSRMLNDLKALIGEGEQIGEVIASLISQSEVTSMNAFDKPAIDYHQGRLAKEVMWVLLNKLKERLPDLEPLIRQQGKRVVTNAVIKLSEEDWGHWFIINSQPQDGEIRLRVSTDIDFVAGESLDDAERKIKSNGLWDKFESIKASYVELFQNTDLVQSDDGVREYLSRKFMVLEMSLTLSLQSVEDFTANEALQDELADAMVKVYQIRLDLMEISKQLEIVTQVPLPQDG